MSYHLQESWKTDQFHYQVLVGTKTFMVSWIHEFMNYQGTWKSVDGIWKHSFMPLYCNCQGNGNSGEPIGSVFS